LKPPVLMLSLMAAAQTGCNMWGQCTTLSLESNAEGYKSGTDCTSDITDMGAMVAAHGAAPKAAEVPFPSLTSSRVKPHDCLQSSLLHSTGLSMYKGDLVKILSNQGKDTCGAEQTIELPVLQGDAAHGLKDCTTLVVRHIPSQYSQYQLRWEIDAAGFRGLWNFLHLPMDSKNRGNRGFAFINFKSSTDADTFQRHFHGKYLHRVHPKGAVDVKPANCQGLYDNVARVAASINLNHFRRKQYCGPLLLNNEDQNPFASKMAGSQTAAPIFCTTIQPEMVPAIDLCTVPLYEFPQDL